MFLLNIDFEDPLKSITFVSSKMLFPNEDGYLETYFLHSIRLQEVARHRETLPNDGEMRIPCLILDA
jgi:hypothetical protein